MPELPVAALSLLRCPACHGELHQNGSGWVGCPDGHRVDPARQGHVNLLGGAGARGLQADTADMVAARVAVQKAGFFDDVASCLVEQAGRADLPEGGLLDLGGGTGYYAARLLRAFTGGPQRPGMAGVSVDLSGYAARRAARAHPLLLSVVADVWSDLPVRTSAIALMLCVFAPRNPVEIDRMLAPAGTLLVATPRPRHLRELVETLDLIAVDADKDDRLTRRLGEVDLVEECAVTRTRQVSVRQAGDLVLMGPNAFHVDGDEVRARLARRARELGSELIQVTLDVRVGRYRARDRSRPAAAG